MRSRTPLQGRPVLGPAGSGATTQPLSPGRGNQFAQERLATLTGQGDAAAWQAIRGRPRSPFPMRKEVEDRFGLDLSGVVTHLGVGDLLAPIGANAATDGDRVAFAAESPSRESIFHEAAHLAQFRRGGGTSPASARGGPAEQEAEDMARSGAAGRNVEARARAESALHFEEAEESSVDQALEAGLSETLLKLAGELPAGVKPPNMNKRHVLGNLEFFKAVKSRAESGNSYLAQAISEADLVSLYKEALALGTRQGKVTLSNGQTWYIQASTGKFFPCEGPGILSLTQQEVRLLEMLVKQVKGGTEAGSALKNLSRAMTGQSYTLSPAMQSALEVVGSKLGIETASILQALAPHAPKVVDNGAPAELVQAAKVKAGSRAFRLVKWGGRILLVVAIAADLYEVYSAENRAKTVTKKVGAWGASLAAGGYAATEATPLLAAGPWGWVGYGIIVGGAGTLGYLAGEEVTETIYEWAFE